MRITKFSGRSNNECAGSQSPGVSFTSPPGDPEVTLTWSTSFASSVDLSVDGPGIYQSGLSPSGSITIGYGCPGPHSYTITAHGRSGTSTQRTVSVSSASTTSACVSGEPCVP